MSAHVTAFDLKQLQRHVDHCDQICNMPSYNSFISSLGPFGSTGELIIIIIVNLRRPNFSKIFAYQSRISRDKGVKSQELLLKSEWFCLLMLHKIEFRI